MTLTSGNLKIQEPKSIKLNFIIKPRQIATRFQAQNHKRLALEFMQIFCGNEEPHSTIQHERTRNLHQLVLYIHHRYKSIPSRHNSRAMRDLKWIHPHKRVTQATFTLFYSNTVSAFIELAYTIHLKTTTSPQHQLNFERSIKLVFTPKLHFSTRKFSRSNTFQDERHTRSTI